MVDYLVTGGSWTPETPPSSLNLILSRSAARVVYRSGYVDAASFGNIHGRMETIAVSRGPCSVASIWCAVVTGSVRVVARRQRRMKINTPRSPSSPSSTQLRIVYICTWTGVTVGA